MEVHPLQKGCSKWELWKERGIEIEKEVRGDEV
jgi:hypothetical protein